VDLVAEQCARRAHFISGGFAAREARSVRTPKIPFGRSPHSGARVGAGRVAGLRMRSWVVSRCVCVCLRASRSAGSRECLRLRVARLFDGERVVADGHRCIRHDDASCPTAIRHAYNLTRRRATRSMGIHTVESQMVWAKPVRMGARRVLWLAVERVQHLAAAAPGLKWGLAGIAHPSRVRGKDPRSAGRPAALFGQCWPAATLDGSLAAPPVPAAHAARDR
jgi:hypothetical protein